MPPGLEVTYGSQMRAELLLRNSAAAVGDSDLDTARRAIPIRIAAAPLRRGSFDRERPHAHRDLRHRPAGAVRHASTAFSITFDSARASAS